MNLREGETTAISIRGHTLLCLQGFQGKGYSRAFVEQLAAIHSRLGDHPDQLVRVIDRPDEVCSACPHLSPSGCVLNGAGSEDEMSAQDRDVMARLGIKAGDTLPWRSILERIGGAVAGADLPDICGHCRWLPLGYCREGLDRLQQAHARGDQPSVISGRPKAEG
jgi:hypothetical protein